MDAQQYSRKTSARIAGAIYLVMSLFGAPELLFLQNYIIKGDATATAQKIAEGADTYRLLMLGGLIGSILIIVLGWSLYNLFLETDRKQALLMLLMVVASSTLGILDTGLLSTPLVLQSRSGNFAAFSPAQLDTLSLALLQIRGYVFRANEALWGVWLIPFGLLIIKSNFIPKIIGYLLLAASVGYVGISFAIVGFSSHPAIVGSAASFLIQCELPVILWLLIMGARNDPLAK
jgi:hypothetical protein